MNKQINADQQNKYLEIGRMIDENSYKREKRRIYLADISAQIDMITTQDGELVIAEIKKSSATLKSGIFQLKYYLYMLLLKNIKAKGVIKIPKERKSENVILNNSDILRIQNIINDINILLEQNKPPILKKKNICKKCAYFEFCWS
jgi:CRISPR-associated exonuclease Cas4